LGKKSVVRRVREKSFVQLALKGVLRRKSGRKAGRDGTGGDGEK